MANRSGECDGVGRDAVVFVKDQEPSIAGGQYGHCIIIVLWLGVALGGST